MIDIDKLAAGRELDILVAEKVFGLTVVPDPVTLRGVSIGEAGQNGEDLPKYSADIAAAWKVLEQFPSSCLSKAGNWSCMIANGPGVADTAPLAICRAALKALKAVGADK